MISCPLANILPLLLLDPLYRHFVVMWYLAPIVPLSWLFVTLFRTSALSFPKVSSEFFYSIIQKPTDSAIAVFR